MRIGWLTIPTSRSERIFGSVEPRCGIFRNRPGINPGRWGWYFYGFEFGSRQPGHWFGVILNRCGLWPW